MNQEVLYAGEDFTLVISSQMDNETQEESLENYKITLALSTSIFAPPIVASTEQGDNLPLESMSDGTYRVKVPASLTTNLPEGLLTLSFVLENLDSGERSVAELRTINVKKPKFKA